MCAAVSAPVTLVIAEAQRAGVLPWLADDAPALLSVLPPGTRPPPLPRPWAGRLPHLAALLRRLRVQGHHLLADDAPLTAPELAQALALGLPHAADDPARIPWAAFETGTTGTPCAWLTPCQWLLGMDHALLADPAQLALSPEHAHTLRQTVAPLLAEAGITLLDDPTPTPPHLRWLAQGEPLRHLPTCTLARARQQRLTPRLLPRLPAALMRLQSEIQMLLQAHPLNAIREAAGQPAVNALWLGGAGALDAENAENAPAAPTCAALQNLPPHAAEPDLIAAWQAVDAACAAPPITHLALCAPHACLLLEPAPRALWPDWLRRLTGS